ncbi:MAG: cupin domain-containing protein [Ruminococcaceae bacterium]|nr:cupin domain-containing protein [Oscillospiraceae bacterium]
MEKLKPTVVDVAKVMPLTFGPDYDSRMILDHVITGRDNVIQVNHGTVKPHYALGGAAHEEDEIYYILSGHGKCKLDDEVIDVYPNQIIFIPAGVFHALDNSESDEDLTLLTMWRDYRYNDAYEARMNLWGKSFRTIDEE